MMQKKIASVEPLKYVNNSNFKLAPYSAWVQAGGMIVKPHYGWRKMRFLLHLLDCAIPKSRSKATLCFAEASTLDIDTFPWWGSREIIPVLWDCWPKFWDATEKWFLRHHVKSAIFTSSQTASEFRFRFPQMNILTITEGVETHMFHGEKPLAERNIDFLQFGRVTKRWGGLNFGEGLNAVCSRNEKEVLQTSEDLMKALSESKIVLCVPRCDTQPEIAGNIETLTQRYWECMLSGTVILGRAPQELIELIGYDPVVPLHADNLVGQVRNIVVHITDYQELACRNKAVALEKADWSLRIQTIRNWLQEEGYKL